MAVDLIRLNERAEYLDERSMWGSAHVFRECASEISRLRRIARLVNDAMNAGVPMPAEVEDAMAALPQDILDLLRPETDREDG